MMRLPNRTSEAPLTMGVDVAKATLEVGFSDRDATLALSNDEVGHGVLLAQLSNLRAGGLPISLIVLVSSAPVN
jgi:transposase